MCTKLLLKEPNIVQEKNKQILFFSAIIEVRSVLRIMMYSYLTENRKYTIHMLDVDYQYQKTPPII